MVIDLIWRIRRGAPAHVQNSVQMSERTDRKVLFERAELFKQFAQNELNKLNSSSERTNRRLWESHNFT
jgi:hypothetical protein